MPIYEYQCENGHLFEVMQSMSDDPVSACEECGAPVERVFHPVAVHFKGSGFYTTDYARKKASAGGGGGEGGGDAKAGDSGSESKPKAESKSNSKAEAKGSAAKAD